MKKRIVLLMLLAATSLAIVGCGSAAKIAELREDFESAMEDGDYDEAEDILDEMKDLDSDNEDYRDCKKEYKNATDIDSKIQLCDTIRTAVTTALMDPEVVNSPTYNVASGDNELGDFLDQSGAAIQTEVFEILGVESVDDIYKQMYTKGDIRINIANGIQITVYVDEGSDITVYAGPLFNYQ